MKKIAVAIFDDGQEPVTCARNFTTKHGFCPFLLETRMGMQFQCCLFSKSFGDRRDATYLRHYEDDPRNFLQPLAACLAARKEQS